MRYLRYLLILALIALAAWHLSPHLKDLKEFIRLTQNINWLFIAAGIFSQTSQYIGDGWLSWLILKMAGKTISFTKTFQIASIDVFAAHMLPVGEAGVLVTAYYFYKKLGIDNQTLIFLGLLWGLATTFSLIIMLAASMLFLPNIPNIPIQISRIFLYFVTATCILALVLLMLRNSLWPKIPKFLSKFPPTREILNFAHNFREHKQTILKNKPAIIKCLIAGFIYYAGNILTLTFCFLAFGQMPPISLITFAYFISLIAGWITLAPGGIGSTDATMLIIFHEFGITPALALAATFAFRIISFWLPIPAGALSYFHLKKDSK